VHAFLNQRVSRVAELSALLAALTHKWLRAIGIGDDALLLRIAGRAERPTDVPGRRSIAV